MDEKVLDLLIRRVEESCHWYTVHNNEAWRERLEGDRKTLMDYCLKVTKKITLPNVFVFTIASELSNRKYTATKEGAEYEISWVSSKGERKHTYYDEIVVETSIGSGSWIIC